MGDIDFLSLKNAAEIHRRYGRSFVPPKTEIEAIRSLATNDLILGELHNIAAAINDLADELVPERKAEKEEKIAKQQLTAEVQYWAWRIRHKWIRDRVMEWVNSYWYCTGPDFGERAEPRSPVNRQWFADTLFNQLRSSAVRKRAELIKEMASHGLTLPPAPSP